MKEDERDVSIAFAPQSMLVKLSPMRRHRPGFQHKIVESKREPNDNILIVAPAQSYINSCDPACSRICTLAWKSATQRSISKASPISSEFSHNRANSTNHPLQPCHSKLFSFPILKGPTGGWLCGVSEILGAEVWTYLEGQSYPYHPWC